VHHLPITLACYAGTVRNVPILHDYLRKVSAHGLQFIGFVIVNDHLEQV